MHQPDEVYILKKYSWLVLTDQKNIDYSQGMKVDPHFKELVPAKVELTKLIALYKQSAFEMFRDFTALLNENFNEIFNSFVCIELVDENGKITSPKK